MKHYTWSLLVLISLISLNTKAEYPMPTGAPTPSPTPPPNFANPILNWVMPNPAPNVDYNRIPLPESDIREACFYVRPFLLAKAQAFREEATREKDLLDQEIASRVLEFKRLAAQYALATVRYEMIQSTCASRREYQMRRMQGLPITIGPAPIWFNRERFDELYQGQLARIAGVSLVEHEKLARIAALETWVRRLTGYARCDSAEMGGVGGMLSYCKAAYPGNYFLQMVCFGDGLVAAGREAAPDPLTLTPRTADLNALPAGFVLSASEFVTSVTAEINRTCPW